MRLADGPRELGWIRKPACRSASRRGPYGAYVQFGTTARGGGSGGDSATRAT